LNSYIEVQHPTGILLDIYLDMSFIKVLAGLLPLAMLIFLTGVTPVWAAHSCKDLFTEFKDTTNIKASRDFTQFPPSRAEINKYLTAVHVTNFIPETGFLTAKMSSETQWFRSTVHFTLGEMVIAHDRGSWEKTQFAVLIPFRHIQPQVINVYHQDTFAFGKVKIPVGATIIHPQGVLPPPIRGVRNRPYNPQKESLREVVDKTLLDEDQWTFKSSGAQYTDDTLLHGFNVNSASFFKNILKDSGITWGMPEHNPLKSINFRLVELFSATKDGWGSVNFELNNWILEKARFDHKLQLGKELLKQRGLDIHRDEQTIRAFKDLNRYLTLIDLEILVQQKYDKTLMGTVGIDAIRMEIWQNLTEDAADIKLVEKHIDLLTNRRGLSTRGEGVSSFNFYTANFSKSEFQELQAKYPQLFQDLQINLDDFFFLKKDLVKTYKEFREGTLSAKEKNTILTQFKLNTEKILTNEKSYNCYQWMYSAVQVKEFIPILLNILKTPKLSQHLEKDFNYDILLKIETSDYPTELVIDSRLR
jgi:hypothetical protein